MIKWLKKMFQDCNRRAEWVAEARKVLAQLTGHWQVFPRDDSEKVMELLLMLGLAHLLAVKTGQEQGRALIARAEARQAASLN
jgi:hypothetical protein